MTIQINSSLALNIFLNDRGGSEPYSVAHRLIKTLKSFLTQATFCYSQNTLHTLKVVKSDP